jgi:soluble lytic murein transglycosylase-like protein
MPIVIAILAVGAFAGFALYLRQKSPALSSAGAMQGGIAGGSGSMGNAGAGPSQKSGVATQFDSLIAGVAGAEGVDPVLLKAIIKRESNFDEEAVNPEKDFVLEGVAYAQYDRTGLGLLHDWIAAGNDPASIGLNPSLGLAQVRVGTGKKFVAGLDAAQLFDPQTNLTASARLLRELFAAGITLDTIDAYNVGQSLHIRNISYRDAVKGFYAQFRGDF